VEVGAAELLIVHDHDADYGVAVVAMCEEAAREHGLTVRTRPVWNHDEPWAEDVGDTDAVLYVGVAGSGAIGLWRGLHAHDPSMWLLGSEGVAEEWLAQPMDASAAERTRFFVAHRAPFALYGYEAMSLVLGGIAAVGGDRAAVAAPCARRRIATRSSAATRSTKTATRRRRRMGGSRSSTAPSPGMSPRRVWRNIASRWVR
jgi:hypothetical protein